jgi:cell division septum initiation protein DivIVA
MTLPVDESIRTPPFPPEPDSATSARIRQLAKSLPESRFLSRGYDKPATDTVLELICTIVDNLDNQLQAQRRAMESVWAELTARRTGYLTDNSMTGPSADLLVNIQRAAMKQSDDIIQVATEQGALIVEMAQAQATELLAGAHAEAGNVDVRIHHLAQVQQVAEALLECLSRNADVLSEAHAQFRDELDRLAAAPATPKSSPVRYVDLD